jgi:hypothetical protein
MAAVLVLARLCEPSSELHIAEDWLSFAKRASESRGDNPCSWDKPNTPRDR